MQKPGLAAGLFSLHRPPKVGIETSDQTYRSRSKQNRMSGPGKTPVAKTKGGVARKLRRLKLEVRLWFVRLILIFK